MMIHMTNTKFLNRKVILTAFKILPHLAIIKTIPRHRVAWYTAAHAIEWHSTQLQNLIKTVPCHRVAQYTATKISPKPSCAIEWHSQYTGTKISSKLSHTADSYFEFIPTLGV